MEMKVRHLQQAVVVALCLTALLAGAGAGPASAGPLDPLDDLICSGLKRVGFTSPVVALPGVGPAANQGLAVQAFYDGDVGLFLLQNDDSVTDGASSEIYDYVMSGYTYRETVYCDDIVCPAVEDAGARVKPVDDQLGSFVSLVELAQQAGCLETSVSQPQSSEAGGGT